MSVKLFSLYDDSENSDMLQEIITEAGGMIHGEGNTSEFNAIVCDTRGLEDVDKLTLLHTYLNPVLPQLSKNGRILMLAEDDRLAHNIPAAAFATAVGGFAKSMAHELGAKGITSNTLHLPSDMSLSPSANHCGALQFLLSNRASFVTGQALQMNSTCNTSNRDAPPVGESPSPTRVQAAARFSVAGKRVVVTGAARGIGEYTARLYAAEGAQVLVVDHPAMEDHIKQLAEDIGGSFLSLDVTDMESPTKLHSAIGNAFGDNRLDIMVHNAGITRDKTFSKMKEDNFRSVIDVNLGSIIRLDKMLLSHSKGVMQKGSRLVYLSSIAGIAGGFGQTNYACSKAGVMGYVSALSRETGIRGIGVNAVAPGFIETEMTAAIPFLVRNVGRRMNAMQQGGLPADIAEAVLFLSSQAAEGLNGHTLRVCGLHRVGA
ncbi:fabG [Symbiodinium microadriaticum]|nr:fabG [Symbiodinium microadriaticum]